MDRIPERVDNAAAKDISGFSHICFTQPPRSVRERERPCQEDSRLLISGNRLAVPPSIVIESNGGEAADGEVAERSSRIPEDVSYYLSFLTRPGNGERGRRPRLLERGWKRRRNEGIMKLCRGYTGNLISFVA